MRRLEYRVTREDGGMAVKDIVRKRFCVSSRLRTKLKKMDLVYLNGEKTLGWLPVSEGDIVEIELPEERSGFEAENIPLKIVYEDDDILVVNKQPYLCVHPTKGQPNHTLANALMHYMEESGQSFKIRLVNRLDRDTSGLVVIGKSSHAQDHICRQMKAGKTKKSYLAVVKGRMEKEAGVIDAAIGRPDPERVERGVVAEGGHPSVTRYEFIENFENSALVRLSLETGRTHQIRVHMASIGHPVLGDHLYGGMTGCEGAAYDYNKKVLGCPKACESCEKNETPIKRQALHAHRLEFSHPMSGETLRLEAPIPEDFEMLLKTLKSGVEI